MADETSSSPEKPRRGSFLLRGLALAVGVIVVVVAAVAWVGSTWLSDIPAIPDREALWQTRRTPGIRFVDHSGVFIAARGAKYGVRVKLGELPPYVPQAFLAAEDRRFYSHGAIDLRGILRAARRDILVGRAAEGGSTLSQQLARTLFLSSEHSLRRKVQEAVLAQRLEDELGKDGILELYLNRAYFGAGSYGLDSASSAYFGHGAAKLTLAEAAVLAGVVNAPSRLAPTQNMAGAWARAGRILQIMVGQGWVTADRAGATEPELSRSPRGEGDWSYALDAAAAQATSLAGNGATDLVVRLTIDAKLQKSGVEAVRSGVLQDGRGREVSQGAMVALAPDGAIRVMVGGLNPSAGGFNRVTQARRQPGSAFKAFVFGAAVEAGDKPSDVRMDAPIAMEGWNPENYGRTFAGNVTLAKALALSINSVAVRLTLEVGPAQVAAFARRCGLTSIPADPGASIALGAYEVTPLELATGYQVFQNAGVATAPYLVEQITDSGDRVLFAHAVAQGAQVLDPLAASRMVRMLEGVINSGTATAANIGRPAAGKTGTSQNWRDAWFVGFTPDLLTAVWVGNDNGRPMNKVTGGELPARIWKRFMSGAEADTPALDFAWLQPEPVEPPSDPLVTDMTEGPKLDEPPVDSVPTDSSSADRYAAPPQPVPYRLLKDQDEETAFPPPKQQSRETLPQGSPPQ